tara:strand:+ start:135 stop:317 length:183 start_codon:yes stop_codon:yes gene_type:complete
VKIEAAVTLYFLIGSFAFFSWAAYDALNKGICMLPAIWLFLAPLCVAASIFLIQKLRGKS